MMNEPIEKTSLENRIKASLEQSARYLDADTQQRLNAIRRTALNQPAKENWFKPSWLKFNGWVPATSLVFCGVIAMLIILPSKQSIETTDMPDQSAMLELLDNPDELDAFSDPDFLMWVEEINGGVGTAHAV